MLSFQIAIPPKEKESHQSMDSEGELAEGVRNAPYSSILTPQSPASCHRPPPQARPDKSSPHAQLPPTRRRTQSNKPTGRGDGMQSSGRVESGR